MILIGRRVFVTVALSYFGEFPKIVRRRDDHIVTTGTVRVQ